MNLVKLMVAVYAAIILVGCGTQRKAMKTETHSDDAIAMQVQSKSDSLASVKTVVDTTKMESGVTMYTEIVFAPVDTMKDTPPPEITVGENGGIRIKGGNVQSIRQFTHESEKVDVGKAETETNVDVAKDEAATINEEHHEDVKETPTADPYRWRYIWRIVATLVAVAIVIVILIFRNKVGTWLRNFMGGFFRIFK